MGALVIMLRQIAAFAKRDFFRWSTYRTAVMTQLITILVGILSWGVVATYVNRPVPEYDTDFISFLIVGLCIGNIVMPLVQGVERLNPWTLETILMTGIRIPVFVVGNVSWNYIFSVIVFIPQLIIGVKWFNAKLNIDVYSTVLAFALSAAILIGLAMISTGMRIVTKSTDPVTWMINTVQQLLAGISFPVQFLDKMLPGVSTISWFLPQTWIYHSCRLAMLKNLPLTDPQMQHALLVDGVFAVFLFTVGYNVLKWGLNRSKKDGTLGWF